jgi:DNA-3-methyladenine glycosylase II
MKILVSDPNAVAELSKMDPVLSILMAQCGSIEIPLQEDYFVSLASAIVGQQLSNRVAEVLWERLVALADGVVTPEKLLSFEEDDLRRIGISYAKIKYLKSLAVSVEDGTLRLDELDLLDEDEILRQLTQVKGIGPWTAEMFMIFSLGRVDVFSAGDGGLQRAVKWLYHLDHVPSIEEMKQISRCWVPYRTIAALYLWRAIDDKII